MPTRLKLATTDSSRPPSMSALMSTNNSLGSHRRTGHRWSGWVPRAPEYHRIGVDRAQDHRAHRNAAGTGGGVRLHRGLRERDALGPRHRRLRTDRRRPCRARRPLSTGCPTWGPGRPDGVPDLHLPAAPPGRPRGGGFGGLGGRRDPLRTVRERHRIDYTADIRLGGVLRLVQPFLGRAFAKLGRDALAGMQRALDARADTAGGQFQADPS